MPSIRSLILSRPLLCGIVAFASSIHNSNAQFPDHSFNPNNPNNPPYGLTDVDHFPVGAYGYCKWGNLMSENASVLPYTRLTHSVLSIGGIITDMNDLFLNIGKSALSPVSPATTHYHDDSLDFELVYSDGTAGDTPPVDYALFRKLHFYNTLKDEISGSAIDGSATKLIVVIHGWNPDSSDPYSGTEFQALRTNLLVKVRNTEWKVVFYNWAADADTGSISVSTTGNIFAEHPTKAAEIAHEHGQHLGELIATTISSNTLQKVQFIAHSAGAWAARAAAKYLAANTNAKVQVTLLDPYMPARITFNNTSLKESEISAMASMRTNSPGQLYLFENYFALDNTSFNSNSTDLVHSWSLGSDLVFGATSAQFAWRPQDINLEVDWTDLSQLTWYKSHAGPVQFYADTVWDSNLSQTSGLKKPLFYDPLYYDYTNHQALIGWKRSMFYQEPQVTPQPSFSSNTYSPGATPTLSSGARKRGESSLVGISFQWQNLVNGVWTDISEANGQAYTVPSVTTAMDGTQYRLVVNNDAGTDVSNIVTLHVGTSAGAVPARPSGLTAFAVSSNQINLSWADNSNNEAGFIIQRKTGTNGTYAPIPTIPLPLPAGTMAYFDTGLTQGTTYFYQVIAAGSPNSDPSNEASAATQTSTGSTRILTVNSINPGSGVHFYLGPNDMNRLADGNSSFFRSYTTSVTATVVAPSTWNGNIFEKWEKDGQDWTTSTAADVVMDTSHTMTAVYSTPEISGYSISTNSSPSNGGGTSGGGTFANGANVTITATPATGYHFLNWTLNASLQNQGQVFSANATSGFLANSNLSLVANFVQDRVGNTITINVSPSNAGTTTGGGSYQNGQNATIAAIPGQEYSFGTWTDGNGTLVSFSSSYTFPVTESQTYTAHFNVAASGAPDLVPTKFSLDSNVSFPGARITQNSAVKNIGTGSTNPFWVYLVLSTSSMIAPTGFTDTFAGVLSSARFSGITSGVEGGSNGYFPLSPLDGSTVSPGQYYVWLIVDPENAAGEPAGNRNNNAVVVPLTVLPLPPNNGPDLVPHDFSVTPPSAFPSGKIEVKGAIKNVGNVTSSGFKYYVSISTSATVPPDKSALNVSGTVPSLGVYVDAGADSGFTLPGNLAPGNYYLWIMVDPENAAGEPAGNRNNNNVVLPFTVTSPPQTFTIQASSSSPDGGSTIGGGSYIAGALVPLVATPATGYRLVSWTENGNVVSGSVAYAFTAGADRTIVANFGPNNPPNVPTNTLPADGATNQPAALTLQASAFNDPDAGDTHAASEWIIRRVSDNQIVFDSGEDLINKTTEHVSVSLDYVTAYQWQVRYKDNGNAWSAYSTPTAFTTQQRPVNSFVPFQATYSGLVESSPASSAFAGTVTITLSSTGTFSASMSLGGQSLRFGGAFKSDGTSLGTISRKGLPSLSVALTLDTTNNTDQITGAITENTTVPPTVAGIIANRAAFSKTKPAPAAFQGSFTVLLPPDPAHQESTAPRGTGYGTLTVDALGAIRFAGMLGDGTAISQAATLSKTGMWPFLVAPYKTGGAVSGWLTLTNTSDIGGTLNWFKTGFSEQINLIGSRYTRATPVLFANTGGKGVMTITGGNLAGTAHPDNVLISTANTVSCSNDKAFTMKLTLTTGAFTGTFADPGGGKPKAFSGVVFKKQNIGAGLFLGNGQTGSIEIDAAQ
jgi:List-Bact-rpt repeat protein/CARDB protein